MSKNIFNAITPDGLKTVVNGLQELGEAVTLGAFVEDLTPRTKTAIALLAKNDFSVKEIQDVIDVSRVQADPFIDEQVNRHNVRKEVLAEIQAEAEAGK